MIVIDIGCARYGGDYSIERLIEEFHPDVLYGFDPNPDVMAAIRGVVNPGRTVIEQKAAWTYDGEIGYHAEGLNSWVTYAESKPKVPCFDLAVFIAGLPAGEEIVLKIDAEGSEYDLLEHLIDTRTDALLKLAWVEWHPRLIENAVTRRGNIEDRIACELAEWRW